jgi:flagellar basal-body rod modification protein FlgD
MTIAIDTFAALNAPSSGGQSKLNEAGSAERFLKLLVTQMQNQDPLNPADNAQITSQMAQINTVSGIETLNTTVQGLNGRFVQMQALQGASLVGRDITVAGDKLAFTPEAGIGGYELAGTADRVKLEVLSPAGRVVETVELGAQPAGMHGFQWQPSTVPLPAVGEGYRFRVVATQGAANVTAAPLMLDRVEAVTTQGERLMLETAVSGRIDYGQVKAVGG